MRYVSKPTECEAMQWDGNRSTADNIIAWICANGGDARYEQHRCNWRATCGETDAPRIAVRAIVVWVYVTPGQYVVMDHIYVDPAAPMTTFRAFVPVDPETFEQQWEAADSVPAAGETQR